MSINPCFNCGQKPPGRLASIISRHFVKDPDGEAWKNQFCADCLITLMGSLQAAVSADASKLIVCPMCGSDASTDLCGTYLWIYPPGQQPRESALTTCTSCATRLLESLSANGKAMPNRGGLVGAQAQAQAPTSTPWDELPW